MFLNLKDSNRFFFSHIANLQHDAWWEGQGHRFDALWVGKGQALFRGHAIVSPRGERNIQSSREFPDYFYSTCNQNDLVLYISASMLTS